MIVVGLIEVEEGRLFNTAIVVDRRILVGRYRKAHLFNGEHIFDTGNDNKVRLFGGENCFEAGSDSHVFEVDGLRFGINICYDTNFSDAARKGSGPRRILDRVPCQQYVPPKDGGGAQDRA